MRVLTSPADTGAVTLALPQDTQAEAYDYPDFLFEKRVWEIPRNRADAAAIKRAAEWIRASQQPLIIAGGGVHYSEAHDALETLRRAHGHPGLRDAGGQGRAGLRQSGQPGRHRRDRHRRRQLAGARDRSGHRHRHALQRFHQRLQDGLHARRASASSTSMWPSSTPTSTARCPWSAMPASRWKSWRWKSAATRSRTTIARGSRLTIRLGMPRCIASTTSSTSRC